MGLKFFVFLAGVGHRLGRHQQRDLEQKRCKIFEGSLFWVGIKKEEERSRKGPRFYKEIKKGQGA